MSDGARTREPVTEAQRKAVLRLNRAERELGATAPRWFTRPLIQGMTMEQVGQRRGLRASAGITIFSRRLANAFDRLALIYGFATGTTEKR